MKKYTTQSEATRILAGGQTHGDMHTGPGVITVPAHDEIAKRAYAIYVKNGRKEGQSTQDWHQAEHELRQVGGRP